MSKSNKSMNFDSSIPNTPEDKAEYQAHLRSVAAAEQKAKEMEDWRIRGLAIQASAAKKRQEKAEAEAEAQRLQAEKAERDNQILAESIRNAKIEWEKKNGPRQEFFAAHRAKMLELRRSKIPADQLLSKSGKPLTGAARQKRIETLCPAWTPPVLSSRIEIITTGMMAQDKSEN